MINLRINPVYILLLFFTLTGVSFFQLNTARQTYEEERLYFDKFKENAKLYLHLKNNEKFTPALNKLIREFDSKSITKKELGKTVLIRIKNKNTRYLNRFINKILKSKFKIKKLSIEKEMINVEIVKWQ